MLATILGLVGLALIAAIVALFYFRIPSNAAGMAAKSVCSAHYVAGRPADQLLEQDVYGASGVLKAISVEFNDANHMVTAKFLGAFPRRAVFLANRGCVLDGEPGDGKPYRIPKQDPQPWPQGEAVADRADWPAGVDRAGLKKVVAEAFVGAGDDAGANARGVAVVQDGKLLASKYAPGFKAGTPLLGWSMAKSVGAMLGYQVLSDKGLDWQTPVVDAFPAAREPTWVAQWRTDERAKIRIADLLFMRDGLANNEGYDPWGAVVQMLYGEPDMAGWAADHKADAPAGTRWQYLSATSNILAQVIQAQVGSQERSWAYPSKRLFDPIGATSATLETDASGTWVDSSYVWASINDWARLGQLTLQDGQWDGEQVLPKGWAEFAATPAMPDGEGNGYGASVWLYGKPGTGSCATTPGFPADAIVYEGHWGQVVAAIPSRDAVIVRMGWTYDKTQFNDCQFLMDVLGTLG